MSDDDILNNPNYHVFAVFDQYEWILKVMITSCNDPSKTAKRNRTVMPSECKGDGYEQIVKEMAEECIKELENG